MKGHAKIELTNVKTGEVQIIEEDNIVTTLLAEQSQTRVLHLGDSFLLSRDRTLSNYDSENKNRLHTPFTEYGGLLMFREQLEADETSHYPKVPVTMTAHASDDTYTGADLTRGSFNTNLSSYNIAEGKATLVWDFNMEQGNGTIGTVCLCNHVDGKIGYGSDYEVEATNNAKAPFFHHLNPYINGSSSYGHNFTISLRRDYDVESSATLFGLSIESLFGYMPVWLDVANNKLILMNTAYVFGSNLEFAMVDIDCTSAHPLTIRAFTDIYTSSKFMFSSAYRNIEYIDIPIQVTDVSTSSTTFADKYLASSFTAMKMWSGLDFKGNFWFSTAYRHYGSQVTNNTANTYNLVWTAGAKMKFTKVNLSTMETTEYEVTNTTGADITANMGFTRNAMGWLTSLCEYNGYLMIRGDNAHLYAINLANNSDVKEVTYTDGTPVLVYKHGNGIDNYTECNGKAYNESSYNYRRGWLVSVLGDNLIINTVGGGIYKVSEGQMLIVDSNFVAKKLSCVQNCYMPESISTTNILDRNSGWQFPLCYSDTPLCLGMYARLDGSNNQTTSASCSTSIADKYATFTLSIANYTYKPMGLLTINTLAEPVTKTADMTMRITYTLTA